MLDNLESPEFSSENYMDQLDEIIENKIKNLFELKTVIRQN